MKANLVRESKENIFASVYMCPFVLEKLAFKMDFEWKQIGFIAIVASK